MDLMSSDGLASILAAFTASSSLTDAGRRRFVKGAEIN